MNLRTSQLDEADLWRPGRRVVVVFEGDTDLWWLRWLSPGFRHCFAVIEDAQGWVIVDPLSHQTLVRTCIFDATVDLAAHYRQHGYIAVTTWVDRAPHRTAPIRPFTCVEAVKRVIGLRAPGVWTPRQLFRRLLEKCIDRKNVLDMFDECSDIGSRHRERCAQLLGLH